MAREADNSKIITFEIEKLRERGVGVCVGVGGGGGQGGKGGGSFSSVVYSER